MKGGRSIPAECGFLAENGIHVPFEPVDTMNGAHKSADFAEFDNISACRF
jgi:hypothetical protein